MSKNKFKASKFLNDAGAAGFFSSNSDDQIRAFQQMSSLEDLKEIEEFRKRASEIRRSTGSESSLGNKKFGDSNDIVSS